MAKPNYDRVRRQKEIVRKARQQEKQQRRTARSAAREEAPPATAEVGALADSSASPSPGRQT